MCSITQNSFPFLGFSGSEQWQPLSGGQHSWNRNLMWICDISKWVQRPISSLPPKKGANKRRRLTDIVELE